MTISQPTKGNVVTVGGFDGVHLAHQFILKKVVKTARSRQLNSAALTFNPLPKVFFDKTGKVKEILDLETKKKSILKLGIDDVYVLNFDFDLAEIEAETFLKQILIKKLKTKILVVGYDFRFGKNRKVGIEELSLMIKKHPGLELIVIPKIETKNNYPNSTKIREYIKQKKYLKASQLLGWDYQIFKSTKEIIFNNISLVAKQSPKAS